MPPETEHSILDEEMDGFDDLLNEISQSRSLMDQKRSKEEFQEHLFRERERKRKEQEEREAAESKKSALEQVKRAKSVFLTLPYEVYKKSDDHDPDETAHACNKFIRVFTQWVRESSEAYDKRKRLWGINLSQSVRALCDQIESGELGIESADDLLVLSLLFGRFDYLFVSAGASIKYFVETDMLMEIIEYTYERMPSAYSGDIIESFKQLYKHEITLKEESEKHGTSSYEDFLSMPIEIKTSMAGCFESLYSEDDQ